MTTFCNSVIDVGDQTFIDHTEFIGCVLIGPPRSRLMTCRLVGCDLSRWDGVIHGSHLIECKLPLWMVGVP